MIGFNPNRLVNSLPPASSQGRPPGPSLDHLAALGLDITLNSVTKTAVTSLYFGDADLTTGWACRADPTNVTMAATPNGTDFEAHSFKDGEGGLDNGYWIKGTPIAATRWQASANFDSSIGTDDGVREIIFRCGTASTNKNIIAARSTATAGGEAFVMSSSVNFQWGVDARPGGSYLTCQYNAQLVSGNTYHIMTAINRDGTTANDMPIVVNGVAKAWGPAIDPTAIVGDSVDCGATPMTALGDAAGGVATPMTDPGTLYAYNAWNGAAWLADGASCASQLLALAQERFGILTGGTGVL